MSLRAMLAVFDHSEATLGNRLVLLALADNAHDDGTNAFPAVETIATKALLDRRTVQRALRSLEEAGEIVRTGWTKNGTAIWTIRAAAEGAASTPQRGGKLPPQGRQDAARTVTNQELTSSGDKLSPLEQARRFSDRSPERSLEDARMHFDGNLGLERAQLDEALDYHRTRRSAA